MASFVLSQSHKFHSLNPDVLLLSVELFNKSHQVILIRFAHFTSNSLFKDNNNNNQIIQNLNISLNAPLKYLRLTHTFSMPRIQCQFQVIIITGNKII